MAIVRDFVIEQGESRTMEFLWRTAPTPTVPSVPIDLTGCTFLLQARMTAHPDSPVLFELSSTTPSGDDLTPSITFPSTPDLTTGLFNVSYSDDYSMSLYPPSPTPSSPALPIEPASKRAVYDLVVTHPDGSKTKLYKGNVVFYPSVIYPP